MITVEVRLNTLNGIRYEEVSISKDELLQIACNKARDNYEDGFVTSADADELEIHTYA